MRHEAFVHPTGVEGSLSADDMVSSEHCLIFHVNENIIYFSKGLDRLCIPSIQSYSAHYTIGGMVSAALGNAVGLLQVRCSFFCAG